jgi:hypothetical protein
LGKFRRRLEAGEFDRDWCIFGNVLNVRRLDLASGLAEGHLAPPCRSMTKLYNFSAIEAWQGPCLERLHGGRVVFKDGFNETMRRDLHQAVSWEDAEFRCLHLCFIPRSAKDEQAAGPRKNIMDVHNKSLTKTLRALWDRVTGKPEIDWKEQRYGRGELVVKPTDTFFPTVNRPT